jgi:hypothetical protein
MWILIRVILLNIIASAFWMWFKDTKMGVWFQRKVDNLLTHIANKSDVDSLKDATDEQNTKSTDD